MGGRATNNNRLEHRLDPPSAGLPFASHRRPMSEEGEPARAVLRAHQPSPPQLIHIIAPRVSRHCLASLPGCAAAAISTDPCLCAPPRRRKPVPCATLRSRRTKLCRAPLLLLLLFWRSAPPVKEEQPEEAAAAADGDAMETEGASVCGAVWCRSRLG